MAETTGISWARSTFNPFIGCTKVGPGCDGCYAEALDARHKWGGATHWGPGVPRYRTSPSNWKNPLKWNAQAKFERDAGALWNGRPGYWPVFCASLADVFDNEVPQGWRADLWELIEATPYLSWLLVTKRIGNVRSMVPAHWLQASDGLHPNRDGFFPPNVRILITVINQEEADRDVPKLLELPCRNGISYEPALGPIDFARLSIKRDPGTIVFGGIPNNAHINALRGYNDNGRDVRIEWLIVGGESTQGKHKARPFRIEWARSTVRQCRAAGVPVLVKQLGSFVVDRNDAGFDGCEPTAWPACVEANCEIEHNIWGYLDEHQGADCRVRLKDRAGADLTEWPDDLRVQEFPA